MRSKGFVLVSMWALAAGACGDVVEALGGDDATRIELELEVPTLVRLPEQGLEAVPRAVEVEVQVPVRMDLVRILREQGRREEADLVEAERDRLEEVELLEVEYEIADPNRLPVALAPVHLDLAPLDVDDPADPRVEPLGTTVEIAPERAIATRELEYADGGREAAAAYLETLGFQLFARSRLSLPPGRHIPPEALSLRLTFKMRVRLRLAG